MFFFLISGDGRTVVRDSVIKVIHALMYSFPPQQMLDILLQQKPSKNPKIREEVVNRVTAAVLTFPRSEFNLGVLCWSVCPLLCDNRRSVRLAALECLSVLAQALGPNRLQTLLKAVDAVQSACGVDGLQNAVQSRLARRALPRVATDGTVRYVLNPQHFSGWFSSTNDADLEWVMMATPSSTGGTPPKRNNGQSGIPLANIPYDVRRKSHVSLAPPPLGDEEEAVVEEMTRRKSIAETDIGKLLVSGQTQERPLLDEFRGQSFNSEEERRDSTDSRGSSE